MKELRKLAATVVLLLFLNPLSAFASQDSCPSPQLSWEIPSNPDFSFTQGYSIFDTIGAFAWEEFVALNWPADESGTPLKRTSIADNQTLKYPRVWESYDQNKDVFGIEAVGRKPSPRISESGMPVTVNDQLIDIITAANDPDIYLKNGELSSSFILRNNEISDPIINIPNIFPALSSIPVIDRTGNYIINEIYVGPEESDQILNNRWNIAQNQWQFNEDKPFNLICSELNGYGDVKVPCNDIYGKIGALELKVAWRIFPPDTSTKEKESYYHVTREFTIPAEQSVTGKEMQKVLDLGLIGVHILHKTSENGWIWSTFEQKDNVPNGKINTDGVFTQQGEPPSEFGYTLYDCPQESCQYNENGITALEDITEYLWNDHSPYAWGRTDEGNIKSLPHTQILRDWGKKWFESGGLTVKENIDCLNDNMEAQLGATGSVWSNYKLIGIEWLMSPSQPFNKTLRTITPVNPVLANVTLEPYIQSMSCIVCHTNAYLVRDPKFPNKKVHSDFSFLLEEAQ